MGARRYMPSNGFEGTCFQELFCDRCTNNSLDNDCPILCTAYIAAYAVWKQRPGPVEWVEDDEHGPYCTAFEEVR